LDRLENDPKQAMEYLFSIPGFDLKEISQMLADPATMQANAAKMMAALQDKQADPNRVDLEKDWHALHFLLTGDATLNPEHHPNDPLHNLVMGGKSTSLEASYGPVRRFDHDDIRQIVAALETISVDELRARFSPEAFNAAEIYPRPRPGGWDLNEMEGVFLYDIDSLQSIAQQSLALRRQQLTAGAEIIAEHVVDFSSWFTSAREGGERAHDLHGSSLRVSES